MCKEGWCVGLGQEGLRECGELSEKEGSGNILKKVAKLGQGVGALKRRVLELPCILMINSLKFYTVYEKKFISCVTLLPDQISLTGCLYFVRY